MARDTIVTVKGKLQDLADSQTVTPPYQRLSDGAIDEIDAAVWSGDMFHHRANIAAFRAMMARWELGLKEAESILDEVENDHGKL